MNVSADPSSMCNLHQSSLLGFVLPNPCDQSVQMLQNILGSIDHMIAGTPLPAQMPLFAEMMLKFNHLLLGAGTILFAIMVFIGTMNTSNEGTLFGRQWNSMWTPMRLIFGLIFVVPLKSGLCLGQKIILFAILIGIAMGTSLWNTVIKDVFNDSATPPVPTYITQYVRSQMANILLYQGLEAIQQNIIKNSNTSGTIVYNNDVPVCLSSGGCGSNGNNDDNNQLNNSVSAVVINAYKDQLHALCNNLFSGYVQQCVTQGINALKGGNASTQLAFNGPGPAAQNGAGEVQFGTNIPASTTWALTGVGESPWTYWKPNDQFLIKKGSNVNYQLPKLSPSDGGTTCSPNTWGGQINCIVQKTVIAAKQDENVCASDDKNSPCSVTGASNLLIGSVTGAELQAQMTKDQGVDPATGLPHQNIYLQKCDISTVNGQQIISNCQTLSKGESCKQSDTTFCRYQYALSDFWIPTAIDQQPTAADHGSIDLTNSWWVAGESYLILDNKLASALQYLYQDIQSKLQSSTGAQNAAGATSIPVTSNLILETGVSIWESGDSRSPFPGGMCSIIRASNPIDTYLPTATTPGHLPGKPDSKCGVLNSDSRCQYGANNNLAYAVSPDPYNTTTSSYNFLSCGIDNMRGALPTSFTFVVQSNSMMPPGVFPSLQAGATGSNTTWSELIQLYDTQATLALSSSNKITGYSDPALYQGLTQVPQKYQFPVGMTIFLAVQKGLESGNNVAAELKSIAGPLYAMVQVLEANHLLGGQTPEMPSKAIMNTVFSHLLGGSSNLTDATDGVMQAVYRLGDEGQGNIVSRQFSMIQQAQLIGVSMIMSVVSSVEQVYQHYATELQNFDNEITAEAKSNATQAGAIAALGVIPGLGGLASGASSIDMAFLQLTLMGKTITTMTQVGMGLAWLPVLMFVMISLFTAGVQFALLVPMMPYILFWAGEIAWLLGVLEAVVAAPIIMLGLATPGGHDFMGHTVPAVKMLLGVVFRPVLMVIGLVTGILLTYVLIHFSAQGFHTVGNMILDTVPSDDSTALGILSVILLITYCSFIVLAFTKCFSPIYAIPEKVMQWIGGQADRAGQEELQQMSSTVQQSAQKGGESGSQAAGQSIDAQKQKSQQTSQQQQQWSGSVAQGASTAASGVGRSGEKALSGGAGDGASAGGLSGADDE